jgi:hypothetical protein
LQCLNALQLALSALGAVVDEKQRQEAKDINYEGLSMIADNLRFSYFFKMEPKGEHTG